ncbi:MAG: SDR family oxidoreductase [Gemmatimonadetes bacterium]|jgi:3-oxoacyl-[acyl-carrier protein] reductase|nr:SDR family oxidoreductase [Gemmatimonadota bacterium]GIT51061.1 MAG: putative oxidoreductase YoxD [Gemmatimonadota bacterium]|tara:strand:- start:159 stop:860 length:702 start_codon:yes stop_codon:yes gene_type:complete
MELRDAVALVTGGSEGIGRAIAEALMHQGCKVTITGRREEVLKDTAEELGLDWIAGDVGNETDAVRTVSSVIERHGRLDILVNNAGYGMFKPLVDTTLDELKDMYQTNVFGTFLMAREAAKQFIKQGSGELINISSTSSLKGSSGRTAYGSSKFALRGMTECWRDELRRHDVRVMLVNPSEVMTDFAAKAGVERERSDKKLRPKEIADAIVGALKVDARGFIPEFSVFATNPF